MRKNIQSWIFVFTASLFWTGDLRAFGLDGVKSDTPELRLNEFSKTHAVAFARFNADGKALVTVHKGEEAPSLYLWDITKADSPLIRRIHRPRRLPSKYHFLPGESVAVTSDGRSVVFLVESKDDEGIPQRGLRFHDFEKKKSKDLWETVSYFGIYNSKKKRTDKRPVAYHHRGIALSEDGARAALSRRGRLTLWDTRIKRKLLDIFPKKLHKQNQHFFQPGISIHGDYLLAWTAYDENKTKRKDRALIAYAFRLSDGGQSHIAKIDYVYFLNKLIPSSPDRWFIAGNQKADRLVLVVPKTDSPKQSSGSYILFQKGFQDDALYSGFHGFIRGGQLMALGHEGLLASATRGGLDFVDLNAKKPIRFGSQKDRVEKILAVQAGKNPRQWLCAHPEGLATIETSEGALELGRFFEEYLGLLEAGFHDEAAQKLKTIVERDEQGDWSHRVMSAATENIVLHKTKGLASAGGLLAHLYQKRILQAETERQKEDTLFVLMQFAALAQKAQQPAVVEQVIQQLEQQASREQLPPEKSRLMAVFLRAALLAADHKHEKAYTLLLNRKTELTKNKTYVYFFGKKNDRNFTALLNDEKKTAYIFGLKIKEVQKWKKEVMARPPQGFVTLEGDALPAPQSFLPPPLKTSENDNNAVILE